MDNTVYQCPECNFNADSLPKLDSHMNEHHSNARDSSQGQINPDDGSIFDPIATKLASSKAQQKYSNDLVNDLTENDAYGEEDEEDEENGEYGAGTTSNKSLSHDMDDECGDEELDNLFNQAGNNSGYNDDDDYHDDSNLENATAAAQFSASNPHHQAALAAVAAAMAKQHQQQSAVRSFHSNIPHQNSATGGGAATGKSRRTNDIANADNHYERQYACKRCDFFTNNPRAVLYHRKEVHHEKINVYECNYCQYASQYTGKVERHVMLRHKLDINSSSKKEFSSVNSGIKGDENYAVTAASTATATPAASMGVATGGESLNKVGSLNGTVGSTTNNNSNLKELDNYEQSPSNMRTRPIRAAPMPTAAVVATAITKSETPNSKAVPCQPAPGTTVVTEAASFSTSPFGITKFQCNKCPCTYKRASDLTKHLKTKHGIIANNSRSYLMQTGSVIPAGLDETGDMDDDEAAMYNQDGEFDGDYDDEENELANSSSNNSEMQRLGGGGKVKDEAKVKTNGGGGVSYDCPYCAYTSNGDDAEYIVHIKDHLCGKTFRCVLCNSVYKYRGDCVVHLKRKHQKADMIAQNFVERLNLDSMDLSIVHSILKPNQTEESESDDKLFGCAYCDYKANYKGDVFKHQTRRHPGNMKSVLALGTSLNGTMDASGNMTANGAHSSSETSSMNNSFNNSSNYANQIGRLGKQATGGVVGANEANDGQKYVMNEYPEDEENMLNEEDYDEHGDEYGNEYGVVGSQNSASKQPHQPQQAGGFSLKIRLNGSGAALNHHASKQQQQQHHYGNGYDEHEDEENYDEDEENMHSEMNGEYGDEMGDDGDLGFDQYDEDETEGDYDNQTNGEDEILYDDDEAGGYQDEEGGDGNYDEGAGGGGESSRFQCKFCSFVGKNSAKLQLHLATHYNLKQYMCPICNRRANFKWDIQKHMRKVHNDYTSEVVRLSETDARSSIHSYVRPRLDGSVRGGGGDDSQLAASDGGGGASPNKSFPSTTLNGALAASRYLIKSKKARHSLRERKYKCSLCHRTSKWQWDIRKHLRTVHKGKAGDVIVLKENEMSRSRTSNEFSPRQPGLSSGMMQARHEAAAAVLNGAVMAMHARRSLPNFGHHGHHHLSTSPSKPFGSPNIVSSIGTDATGNKKFKCKVCPYRTNWKADLFRHIRKRHLIPNPGMENLVILSADEAARTIGDYEAKHGINVRKRTFTESTDPDGGAGSGSGGGGAGGYSSGSSCIKRFKNQDHYDSANDVDNDVDSQQDSQSETVTEHPVSIASLNIKPFQCAKCGYRSDRKADTLRHLKNKHLSANTKFLKILSIKEASETVEAYDRMRLYKRVNGPTPALSLDAQQQQQLNGTHDESGAAPVVGVNGGFGGAGENGTKHETFGHSILGRALSRAPAVSSIGLKTANGSESNHSNSNGYNTTDSSEYGNDRSEDGKEEKMATAESSSDYYRCPFCVFKHLNKMTMRRHLLIHYRRLDMNSQPTAAPAAAAPVTAAAAAPTANGVAPAAAANGGTVMYRCNSCSFKSIWQYAVKRHMLKAHLKQANMGVLKLKKTQVNNETVISITNNTSEETATNGGVDKAHHHDDVDDELMYDENGHHHHDENGGGDEYMDENGHYDEHGDEYGGAEDNYDYDEMDTENENCEQQQQHGGEQEQPMNGAGHKIQSKNNNSNLMNGYRHSLNANIINNGHHNMHYSGKNMSAMRIKLEKNGDQNENKYNNSFSGTLASESTPIAGGRCLEKVILTDYAGTKFTATYLVENGSSMNSPTPTIDPMTGQLVHKKKMYFCQSCPYKTNNYCNLKQHLIQHKFNPGFFKCRFCDYYVSMVRLLKQHEVLHPEYMPRDNLNPTLFDPAMVVNNLAQQRDLNVTM